MASQQPSNGPVGPDTLITVKVLIDGTNRRFKLALRDLGAHVLPEKLRFLLSIPPECHVQFERFSDSAATYVILDSTNPAIYKQLYRAAKAKLKLRLKAVVTPRLQSDERVKPPTHSQVATEGDNKTKNRLPHHATYLETVLAQLPPLKDVNSASKPSQPLPCSYPDPYELPAPCGLTLAAPYPTANLSRPTLPTMNDFSCGIFSIDCNYCGNTVINEHYHCSICEKGDFDLCQACVDKGLTCPGESHWLIKRTIKNGRVSPSVTETVPPKTATKDKVSSPAAAAAAQAAAHDEEERTCNSCISQLPASSFVTCSDCPDFDLCYHCFTQGEHGHHPAHIFQPVDQKSAFITASVKKLLGAGRGLHHDAYCDGCDQQIVGVRNKCLSCPDFDYCSTCVKNASLVHPGHRFAPLYEQLVTVPNYFRKEVHRGIFCDGPLCSARQHKAWIRGDRYKCSVCEDFDLCANCEAIPHHAHNRTHPLIKMKSPIRFVNIATLHETESPRTAVSLGDRPAAKNASTETTKSTSINAATQVQTVAEVKPVESPKPVTPEVKSPAPTDLQAWFESDSTPDGTHVESGHHISQSWTLRNPGPQAWPAGCAVYYIGGDDMRNLEMKYPSSVSTMAAANQSNVLSEPLEAGKTAVFTVLLKSPARVGRAISYWRLKTPEGHPFGHKLWVDINVANKPAATVAKSENVPTPEPFQMPTENKSLEGSAMIFPKLDKESPESSIHEETTAAGAATATVETATFVDDNDDDEDLIEDLESLDLDHDEADGFLTDEEYDILDADDEEFLEEAQRVVANQK